MGWMVLHGIDVETADEIDRLLRENTHREEIVVDRDRLQECCESWIYVKLQGRLQSLIENSMPAFAILTWPNSD